MEDTAEVVVEDSNDIAVDDSTEVEPIEANEDEVVVDGQEDEDSTDRYLITVDGEEQEVTLDELLNGYQRQADYTRKTQSLASEREQLATMRALEQALTADPAAALAALAEAYGVQHTGNQDLEDLDPLERRVIEVERNVQRQQEAARLTAIQSAATNAIEANSLEGVSAQELIAFATQRQIGDLDSAALLMAVQREREASKRATVVKVTESKRKASVVEGGRQRGQQATQPVRPKTIAEAFKQAKSQIGS